MATLGPEWHISTTGQDIITGYSSIKDKQKILTQALNTDLKEICSPVLSNELSRESTSKIVLQIQKIRNISAPRANEDSQAAPRMLKLSLTDGDGYVQALEMSLVNSISRNHTPPGSKLLVNNAKIVSGYLLLTSNNCILLGGRVPHLVEKWELAKSVNRTQRRNSCEDGPPPWVNFGIKIQSCGQDGNFASLGNKDKETNKDNSEFELQRQGAIAEATTGAVRKVFGGRVKHNVQPTIGNQPKYTEKKDLGKNKNKLAPKEREPEEKPQKPSDKVSLFAFLEDKLPVSDTPKSTDTQNVYSTNSFNKCENLQQKNYSNKGYQNYNYQANKPTYQGNNMMERSFNQNNRNESFNIPQKYNLTNNKPFNQGITTEKSFSQDITSDKSYNKNTTSEKSYNHYNRLESGSQQNYTRRNDKQQFNNYQRPNDRNNINSNSYQNNSRHYDKSEPNNVRIDKQNNSYRQNMQPRQTNPNNNSTSHASNILAKVNKEHESTQNNSIKISESSNNKKDISDVIQNMQKVSLNSQFASRSLRQHLNLGPVKTTDESIKEKEQNSEGQTWNVGDECLAKYWEDGKFYNAIITAVTNKTFAVKFKGYGNIEEILKTDCLPVPNYKPNNNPEKKRDPNKHYSGSVEFRRSTRNY